MGAGDVIKGVGVATAKGPAFDIFPTKPDINPFNPPGSKSASLQSALNAAIDGVLQSGQTRREPRDPTDPTTFAKTFPVPITIADLSDGISKVHVAHYNGDEMDFVASEAKVPVMYAAFQLRNMVKRFATELGITTKKDLFEKLHRLDEFILANDKVPILKAAKDIEGNKVTITGKMRLPQYEQMFKVTEGPLTIEFDGKIEAASTDPKIRPTSPFGQSMFEMIVASDDPLATRCIDMIGFSFLNGALVAGGYFEVDTDPTKSKGLWVSGDYASRQLRAVMTVNDGAGKLVGTTRRFAQMMAAIQFNVVPVLEPPLVGMTALLEKAVSGTVVALAAGIPQSHFLGNKVGFDEVGRRFGTQPRTYSEVSALKSASGKQYVLAWQNLQTKKPTIVGGKPSWGAWQLYSTTDMANIVRATVRTYEGLAATVDPFP
jgi:hypothetical protein